MTDRHDRFDALFGTLLFLAIWHFGVGLDRSGLIPTPSAAIARFAQFVATSSFWLDIGYTCYRWVGGFIIGCVIGIPLGLVMGVYPRLYSSLSFVFDFLRSLPVTAIFPVFLLLFGIGDASKIAMVFAATIFVMALNAAYGVINATSARTRMARAFGATPWQVFRYVYLYEAAPLIVVGMKSTLSIALIVVIVSEMFIGTRYGLGQQVFIAYQKNLAVDLFAVLIVVGILGYLSNVALVQLERRVDWSGQ